MQPRPCADTRSPAVPSATCGITESFAFMRAKPKTNANERVVLELLVEVFRRGVLVFCARGGDS